MDLSLQIKDISSTLFGNPLYLTMKNKLKAGKWICGGKNNDLFFIKIANIEEFENIKHAEKINGVNIPKLVGKYVNGNNDVYIISEFILAENLEKTYKRDVKTSANLFKTAVEILAKIHNSINVVDHTLKDIDLIKEREKKEIESKLSNIMSSFSVYQQQLNYSKITQVDIDILKKIDIGKLIDGLYCSDQLVYLHGDYKPDNLLVIDDTLIVVDWQGARVGSGWYDLAYLLADVDDLNHLKTKEFIDLYFRHAQQLNLYENMQENHYMQCFTYGRIYQEIIRTHSNVSLKSKSNVEQYETGIKNLVGLLDAGKT